MPLILDGKIARMHLEKELKGFVEKLSKKPKLCIIQIGDDSRSNIYIKQKKKCAAAVGIEVEHVVFDNHIPLEEIEGLILKKNNDSLTSGIIMQLPLPENFDKQKLIDLIYIGKDVDGLTSLNKEMMEKGDEKAFVPATAGGIMSLLSYYKVPIKGKKIAVLGRSSLVGAPTALMLKRAGGEVTVCHSKTPNTKETVLASLIVVVAIGKPNFIDESYVKHEHIIIDVGINSVSGALLEEIPDKKVVGDVNFSKVAPLVTAISPVPGGVGPMTVISLMENVFRAECDKIASRK